MRDIERVGRRLTTALCAGLAAACGGPSDGGKVVSQSYTCEPFVGAQVSHAIDPGCTACSVTDEANAADADPQSIAVMTLPLSAGSPSSGASIRATAPPGVVFPGGNFVGAVAGWDRTVSESLQDRVVIRTYLAGQLQDEEPADDFLFRGVSQYSERFFGIVAHRPYDAVEFRLDHLAGFGINADVHELCSNGTAE